MLSLSCKAAIKSVVYLGSKFESGEKTGIKEIAEFINENEHTVGKLLQKLVKDEIINSAKGPSGGFYLNTKQSKQRVISIVEAIDGKGVFKQCGLGFAKCSESRPCPFHDDYKVVRDRFKDLCENNRVDELYAKFDKGLAYLIG